MDYFRRRAVFGEAVAAWALGALALALAVSRGEVMPAILIEAPVMAAMLALIVVCQAFPLDVRASVGRRLAFLVGAAIGQLVLCMVLGFLLTPLWFVSPFLGMALACIVAAMPWVNEAMRRSRLFAETFHEDRRHRPRRAAHA